MAILKQKSKTKKLDLSNFFEGEEAYITLKYINRDVWRYANRLTLKTIDTIVYNDIIHDKTYKQLQKKIEEASGAEKIKLLNELNNFTAEKTTEKYLNIDKAKIDETAKIENEKNKLLIENGIDENEHNIYNENNIKLKLNYEVLRELPFFDFVLNEIIKFNGEFDLGE